MNHSHLPYDQIVALATVVKLGSFQAAASALHITQPAVSQRIAQLEESFDGPLLLRTNPPTLTQTGSKLVAHARRVQALEEEFWQIQSEQEERFKRVRLGVNADSLASWFLPVLSSFCKSERALFDLEVDNEDHTFELMRQGAVHACISSRKKPLPGCESLKLGAMSYLCVATPNFEKKYFKDGFTVEAIKSAPAVLFNSKDKVHQRFLVQVLGRRKLDFPAHTVPSSEGFVSTTLEGMAYGLVPALQAKRHIGTRKLVNLLPDAFATVDLYYHYARHETMWESKLREALVIKFREVNE